MASGTSREMAGDCRVGGDIWRRRRARAILRAVALITTAVALWLALGCHITPEEKKKVLHFFFDGVDRKEIAARKAAEAEAARNAKKPEGHPRKQQTAPEKLSVHPPYDDRECEACHASMDSKQQAFRAGQALDRSSELCFQCHEREEILEFDYLHGPVAAQECRGCHLPHDSKYVSLLKNAPSELCFECHDKAPIAEGSHKQVAGRECNECHSPHGGENPFFIKAVGAKMCLGCHGHQMKQYAYMHGPVAVGQCLVCHLAGQARVFTGHERLVSSGDVCAECHTIQHAQLVKMGADDDSSCVECHNPHGAGNEYLLRSQ